MDTLHRYRRNVTYSGYASRTLATILCDVDIVKTRRAEYAEQTRAALLAAAARAFADQGFTSTSITQIAEAARVTKGAVYHHFSDKNSLFEAVMHQYNEAAQQKVYDAIAQHPDDLWGAAMAALEATLDMCADPVAGRLIYLEGPTGLGWKRWRELERQYTHHNVRQLLLSSIEAGIFPADIPREALTQLMSGMITHAGIALAETSARSRKRIRRELQDAIIRVLRGLMRDEPSDAPAINDPSG
jgi:AcrR family transcriptional regulator